jgi:hypothetical protein
MTRRALRPGEVPFLTVKQIEQEVQSLLGGFAENIREVSEPPVPVDEIAELHLELILEIKDMRSLFQFGDVHGAIWFKQRTIGIEKSLDPSVDPSRLGRYHFTLAHEIGHWCLHRNYFLNDASQQRLFDDGSPMPDVVCRSSQSKQPVEWQADAFAAELLMPRQLMHVAWMRFRDGDERPAVVKDLLAEATGRDLRYRGRAAETGKDRELAVKEAFCHPLAEEFQVSREAMRIRLESLGLLVHQRTQTLF